ncbi:MAG: hypothetical protein AAF698_11855, partial [Pseudomonadota bacterium]
EIAVTERPRPTTLAGNTDLAPGQGDVSGLAALSLTQRLVEGEGGSFAYGPASDGPGTVMGEMRTTVVFALESARQNDLQTLTRAVPR